MSFQLNTETRESILILYSPCIAQLLCYSSIIGALVRKSSTMSLPPLVQNIVAHTFRYIQAMSYGRRYRSKNQSMYDRKKSLCYSFSTFISLPLITGKRVGYLKNPVNGKPRSRIYRVHDMFVLVIMMVPRYSTKHMNKMTESGGLPVWGGNLELVWLHNPL